MRSATNETYSSKTEIGTLLTSVLIFLVLSEFWYFPI